MLPSQIKTNLYIWLSRRQAKSKKYPLRDLGDSDETAVPGFRNLPHRVRSSLVECPNCPNGKELHELHSRR